ncbi:MAG: 2,3-dihydroxy-2,3-dihydro-p-cumate dehydrogenase, partial [Pseudonocardiales bacterium]|nr:2,3-dihydroxy-2,3-dihydro-p-cumate dehydrogenase [Pseudonocardiales bacterium]
MTGVLHGRAAIVTGGATGIGLGITRRLLADGASVLVGALGDVELKGALDALRADGHEAVGFVGNLSEQGRAEELLAAAVAAFGAVDILVNN